MVEKRIEKRTHNEIDKRNYLYKFDKLMVNITNWTL